MRRRLFNTLSLLSLGLCAATGILWLKHACHGILRAELSVGEGVGIVGGYNAPTPEFPRFKLVAHDGFELSTFDTLVTLAPSALDPPYVQWNNEFRRRDREWQLWGFAYVHGALISYPDDPRYPHHPGRYLTRLLGYETRLFVPYWFVMACTLPLPLHWARRRVRGRKRRRLGLCLACGYDLRASTGRCPECGAAAAGHT